MSDLAARTVLAATLLADDTIPARVTETMFGRHPEWEARFGAAGRRRCTEDGRFHLSFLAGAVQAGSPGVFAEYATWCAAMLRARMLDPSHLIEHLELLEALVHVGDGERLVGQTLAAARAALAVPISAPPDDSTPIRLTYLAAALSGRRAEAWEATREARRQGSSVAAIYGDLLLWSQRRLGELWAAAQITVAQEHMASAVTQSIVARMYSEISNERRAGRVLIAGVEGELHALPALIVADLLELAGWDVAFVGTHVPQASVLAAIEHEKPDVLGLSTTMAFNLPKLVALITAVRAKYATLPIVIGGGAARAATQLASELSVVVDDSRDGAAFRAFSKAPDLG